MRQAESTALDTSGWVNKVSPKLEAVLKGQRAAAAAARHAPVRDAGLLVVHMAHLTDAVLRLSGISGSAPTGKRFQAVLGSAAAHAERVATLAKAVCSPFRRAAKQYRGGELFKEAQVEALFVSLEAILPATDSKEGPRKQGARKSTSPPLTSRRRQGKRRAIGRARYRRR